MRGGKREGSGRKKKEPTTTISFRVTENDKKWLKESYPNINPLFKKFVDYLKCKSKDG